MEFRMAIQVIDNFLEENEFNKLSNSIMGDNFPWYYIDDVTAAYEDDNQGRPGLSHVYVELDDDDSSEVVSDFHEIFIPMLQYACHYLNMPTGKILQGRSFMQFPLNLQSKEDDTPHIDLDEGFEDLD